MTVRLGGAPRRAVGDCWTQAHTKALTRLNLALPKSVLASPQVFAIRAIDLDNKMERYYRNSMSTWIEGI
ncbi:MAG: hypothetical protein ACLR23_11925 [Clostridia bacterium]